MEKFTGERSNRQRKLQTHLPLLSIMATGLLLMFICAACPARPSETQSTTPPSTSGSKTSAQAEQAAQPPPSDEEINQSILASLRQKLKAIHGQEFVFAEKRLNVKNDWAWVHVRPESPDGANQYEDVLALLRLQQGSWKVVEVPCMEVENPDCYGDPNYPSQLQKKFPELPAEIRDSIYHEPQ